MRCFPHPSNKRRWMKTQSTRCLHKRGLSHLFERAHTSHHRHNPEGAKRSWKPCCHTFYHWSGNSLYQSMIPCSEKLIAKRTDHFSENGARSCRNSLHGHSYTHASNIRGQLNSNARHFPSHFSKMLTGFCLLKPPFQLNQYPLEL